MHNTLFHEEARQSLQPGNVDDNQRGVTALCSKMHLECEVLVLQDLSVVSGSRLLKSIVSNGEKIKEADDAFVLFRVHEIPQAEHRNQIAICTSWQSAVTAIDLRRMEAG